MKFILLTNHKDKSLVVDGLSNKGIVTEPYKTQYIKEMAKNKDEMYLFIIAFDYNAKGIESFTTKSVFIELKVKSHHNADIMYLDFTDKERYEIEFTKAGYFHKKYLQMLGVVKNLRALNELTLIDGKISTLSTTEPVSDEVYANVCLKNTDDFEDVMSLYLSTLEPYKL